MHGNAVRIGRHVLLPSTSTETLWAVRIGLEIHAQLLSRGKLFSSAPGTWVPVQSRGGGLDGAAGDAVPDPFVPNAAVGLVDAAMPGSLPILSEHMIHQAVRAGHLLRAQLQPQSAFERKHYSYPDLPAGYQITQRLHPVMRGGALRVVVPLREDGAAQGTDKNVWVPFERVQLETDSGRSLVEEGEGGGRLVDLNRAGTGLLEVVSQPTIGSPEEAAGVLRRLQAEFRRFGVCDGRMDMGSMRCDVNVSLHAVVADGVEERMEQVETLEAEAGRLFSSLEATVAAGEGRGWEEGMGLLREAWHVFRGDSGLLDGERVEMKNLPSVRAVLRGAWHEIHRQLHVFDSGGVVERETRSYDVFGDVSKRLRSKEDLPDYRFLPEPDLPPLLITPATLHTIQSTFLPHHLDKVEDTWVEKGLSRDVVSTLISEQGAIPFLTEAISSEDDVSVIRHAASILQNEILGRLLNSTSPSLPPSPSPPSPPSSPPWDVAVLKDADTNPFQGVLSSSPLHPSHLRTLASLIASQRISSKTLKALVDIVFGVAPVPEGVKHRDPSSPTFSLEAIIDAQSWWMVRDQGQVRQWCEEVVGEDEERAQKIANDWLGPRNYQKSAGVLIGAIMKKSKGSADPKEVREVLKSVLEEYVSKSS